MLAWVLETAQDDIPFIRHLCKVFPVLGVGLYAEGCYRV